MQPERKVSYPEPLSEDEKRHFSKYGKWPGRAVLIRDPKERTYFDSGDYALSAAHAKTDNDDIRTGRTHPSRGSISHPYAPVPSTSNVGKDANRDLYRKSASPERSPLRQRSNSEDDAAKKDTRGT